MCEEDVQSYIMYEVSIALPKYKVDSGQQWEASFRSSRPHIQISVDRDPATAYAWK